MPHNECFAKKARQLHDSKCLQAVFLFLCLAFSSSGFAQQSPFSRIFSFANSYYAGEIVTSGGISSGTGWADNDNDGHLDMFVANWIRIKCDGVASNKFGVGAKVWVEAKIDGKAVKQLREICTNYGYRSQGATEASFGLGDATIVERVKIEWPSGTVDELVEVKANQMITVTEGKGISQHEQPSPPGKRALTNVLFPTYQNALGFRNVTIQKTHGFN